MNRLLIFNILFLIASSFQCLAQDPQLFENDWYIQKVKIDSEDHFPPNSNTEPVTGSIQFDETEDLVYISYCDFVAPMINYVPVESIFSLEDDPIVLIGDCIEPANKKFGFAHFTIYYEPTAHLAKNPFSYTIGPGSNEILILTIENMDGNQAVYGNELLSNQTFDISSFKIYPNPVSDLLTLSSPNNEILAVHIYNLEGKQISSFKGMGQDINEISLANLDSGIYFLKIFFDGGQVTKKIIKK